MKVPSYFKQEKQSTCSLAVLRMVLDYFGLDISENELLNKVRNDYGNKFSNIWNPTIAKLACEYRIDTTLYAEWPLLREENLNKALEEYRNDSNNFNLSKYENKDDKDELPEPLPLAYKELFRAVEEGCKAVYGKLTEARLKSLLSSGYLIQTSIKLHLMYPDKKSGFHSILIFGITDNKILFHDPFNGEAMSCSVDQLLKSATDVGASMAYIRGSLHTKI